MNWINDYQLFLFDFDGLLVDTEKIHFAAYQQLCAQKGFILSWDFERFCREAHGRANGIWHGLKKEFPEIFFSEEELHHLSEERKALYVALLRDAPLTLLPGVEEVLQKLADLQLKRAVVTNSPESHIAYIKKKIPLLDTIPLWITREHYGQPKPSPEGYLKAIELMAKPTDKIVGFEDTLKGIQALLGAGVNAVGIGPPSLQQTLLEQKLKVNYFPSFLHI